MFVIPRIELRGGACAEAARTARQRTEYAFIEETLEVARAWAALGFQMIHLVDRDAIAGKPCNAVVVEEIIRDGAIAVQINEAVESGDRIEELVSAGAGRVVLGPRAIEEPDWLARSADLYPGLLVVASDSRERRPGRAANGRDPWALLDLATSLSAVPIGGLLTSAPGADGGRGVVELGRIEDVAEASNFPVIVDAGVRTVAELRALEHRGVSAVILGEPLYDGEMDARRVAVEFTEA